MEGVTFSNHKRSDSDYGAIMNYARITPPPVKKNYVDIAGGDSSLDLTESVGGVRFDDGQIEFMFTFREESLRELMKNELHGKRMKFFLDRDCNFFYDGRLFVTKEERNGVLFSLHMEAVIKPYKYDAAITVHREMLNGEEKNIIIPNSRMPVMPKITVEGNIYLRYDGREYVLSSGTYEIAEVTLYEGDNRITLSGSGTIQFQYRKGKII